MADARRRLRPGDVVHLQRPADHCDRDRRSGELRSVSDGVRGGWLQQC